MWKRLFCIDKYVPSSWIALGKPLCGLGDGEGAGRGRFSCRIVNTGMTMTRQDGNLYLALAGDGDLVIEVMQEYEGLGRPGEHLPSTFEHARLL